MENSSTNRDIEWIEYVIQYCNDIKDAVRVFGNDEEDFTDNIHFQRSCVFSMQQIGEIVKRLSDGLKGKHPEVEWREISKFRDFVSHKYNHIDLHQVWLLIMTGIDELREQCKSILTELKV